MTNFSFKQNMDLSIATVNFAMLYQSLPYVFIFSFIFSISDMHFPASGSSFFLLAGVADGI